MRAPGPPPLGEMKRTDPRKFTQMVEVKCVTCGGENTGREGSMPPGVKNDHKEGLKLYCPGCDVVTTFYIHEVDGKFFIGTDWKAEEWRG